MPKSEEIRRITVAEMAPHVHSFFYGENKVEKITKWLSEWIDASLESGKIRPYDYLPLKGDLAFHIGVSLGTMQNVFRNLEDKGLVESKQRKGTYIKDRIDNGNISKMTSRREKVCEEIKYFLKSNNYKNGDTVISVRKLAQKIGISASTIRNAMNSLISQGIIRKENTVFKINRTDFCAKETEYSTLTQKTAEKIKQYISKDLKIGDKLRSHQQLAKQYKVSIKTVHDALKLLEKDGVINMRRGNYGTFVADEDITPEYFYEKTEYKIKEYIRKNSKIGDKLPTIREFSKMLSVSSKTVKKALDIISDDGYVTFERGRYGGTFVTDIPQSSDKGYTWLALSPEYEKLNEN